MHKEKISDEQIIARAEALGMEFPEDTLFPTETDETESSETTENTETGDKKSDSEKAMNDDSEASKEAENDKSKDTENVENSDNPENSDKAEDAENADAENASEKAEGESEKEEDSKKEENQKEDYLLVINRGAVCRDICDELYQNGLVDDSEALRVYLGNVGYASNISVGKYKIPYGLSYEEIYNILKAGPMEEE